jgi:predicted transcriptional regulator
MVSKRVTLMSIRPEFAERIFDGEKRVELRRQRPRLEPGDVVLVYTTSPHQAVRGAFEVQRVVSKSVPSMWRTFGPQLGVSRGDYDRYFEGCEFAHGIEIGAVRTWRPFSISTLRKLFNDFRPPQSYMHWPERWSLPSEWRAA